MEKSTNSSAQKKTQDFLKRNANDKPENTADILSAMNESFDMNNLERSYTSEFFDNVQRSRSYDVMPVCP